MIDYDEFLALAENSLGAVVTLSGESTALINSLLSGIDYRSFKSGGEALTSEQRDLIEVIIAGAFLEVNSGEIIVIPEAETFFGSDPPTYSFDSSGQGNGGMRWRSDVDGVVTGLKYYRTAATGTNVSGALWELNTFTTLGTVDFEDETVGWKIVEFEEPIPINAEEHYTVSVFSLGGGFPTALNYFDDEIVVGHITAIEDGVSGIPNGLYNSDSVQSYPSLGFMSLCFFADFLFIPDE